MAVRCRQIVDADLPAVVELLWRGLPGRPRDFWLRGLQGMSSIRLPCDLPRYGYVLESDGQLVGVTILIHADVAGRIRCHLSSWYVEPPFRAFGALMVNMALKRQDVTYVNISPNPSTWSIIEAQGFVRYVSGQCLSLPSLCRSRPCRVRLATASDDRLLVDHAALGCLCLVVEAEGERYPFVFMREERLFGRARLATAQLIYCRDIASFVRFAGPIGRYLLRWRIAIVAHDADGPEPGLVGRFSISSGPRYCRGPHPPRLGDLAYSEWVVFGPGLRGEGRFSLRSVLRGGRRRAPTGPLPG